jgi:hypothetical protein
MKCQLFDKYLFDYCDDNLAPVLREKIDQHLQECSNCRNQVKLTILENEVLRDNSDLPILSGDFANRVMHQITISEQAASIGHKRPARPGAMKASRFAMAAAAVGLVVLVAVLAPHIMPLQENVQVADAPSIVADQKQIAATDMSKSGTEISAGSKDIAQNKSIQVTEPVTELTGTAYSDQVVDTSPPLTESARQLTDQVAMADVSYSTDTLDATANPPEAMYSQPSQFQSTTSRQGALYIPPDQANKASNLPSPPQVLDGFTLINTVNSYSSDGSVIIYNYTDKDRRSLNIALKNAPDQEPILMRSQATAETMLRSVPEDDSAASQQVEYSTDIGGKTYLVTLGGTLSLAELSKMINEISFGPKN